MGIKRYDEDIPEQPLDSPEAGEQESLLETINQALDGCLGAVTVLFALGAVAVTMLGAAAWRAKNPIPRVCPICGGPCSGDDNEWWCLECGYGGSR